jgi:hypothetical protein
MLFPGDPASDPFVRAGTYEIRGPGDGAGGGMVLAALSPDAFWFDEFARGHAWDRAALVRSGPGRSGAGADAVAALTDIVQRMLGAGSFNYDFATYAVAPRAYALGETAGPPPSGACVGCSFTEFTVVVVAEPPFACHQRFARCFSVPHARHRPPVEVAPAPAAIALYSRGGPSAVVPPATTDRSMVFLRRAVRSRPSFGDAPPSDVATAPARGMVPATVIAGISTLAAAPALVPAPGVRAPEWEPRWAARAVRPVGPESAVIAQPQTLALPLVGWTATAGGARVVHTAGRRR